MGVRVNQEGLVQCDYHTVLDGIKSSGSKGDTVISHRYYVADADYLIGLEGNDRTFLETLDAALQSPCWQLYFGRKSFVPSCPVAIKVCDEPLLEALKHRVELNKEAIRRLPRQLRCVIEVPDSLDVRQDVPINWQQRSFGSRCVDSHSFSLETDLCISQN